MSALDETLERARGWIGRSETATGPIAAGPADILAATFDRDDPPLKNGDPIPPGWHWYYFPEVVKLCETGPDGHKAKGGFMPPVPLPRRMWAGRAGCASTGRSGSARRHGGSPRSPTWRRRAEDRGRSAS